MIFVTAQPETLAGAASQVVASHYKATGQSLPMEEAKRLASIAIDLQNKFKSMMPAAASEPLPNTRP